MMRKIPNYEYRGNRNNKNSSDSSSGCEDDFDADDSYVNDSSELDYCKEMNTAIETSLNLNHSPMPHFPPPPDYPPPGSLLSAHSQTQQRSRYYYYESGKSDMNSSRRRVGSLDRDCGYTTDGNEMCSRQNLNHHGNGHSANNSFSSTSSSSNSSVVIHKTKKMPQTQLQTRYPMSATGNSREPTSITTNGCHQLESIEMYTNEQEKRFPFKSQSATTTKTNKNRMYLDAMLTMNNSSKVNVMSAAELEQNSIRLGESAASIARETKCLNDPEPEVKWMRNNISATMERFHPSPSTSKHSNGVEHLYQQIDESPRSQYEFNHMAGPSKPPPPNSMRALLMTANRNAYRMSPTMRHMYTNRYGTQENIYEEISSEERLRLLSGGHSMMSLQGTSVEEEFRRVQNRHRRILGELNLSVEAMLMPATPPDSPEPTEPNEASSSESQTRLNELLNVVGPTDELLSPVSIHATTQNNTCDIDSGFSGSSSGGASYLGSLRYKNGLPTRSSTPNGHSSASSCRSSQRSNEDPGILMISSRSSALYRNGLVNGNNMIHTIAKSHRFHSAEDPGPNAHYKDGKVIVTGTATTVKSSFWNRKSWRKFPGFSSNTSVNKAGLSNDRKNNCH